MNSTPTEEFQKKVKKLLVRNSNIMDILTKCQICCGKICRSSVRAATGCSCIEINSGGKASSKIFPGGIEGNLCPECRSTIENEIGEILFYIASLCNVLDISMTEIMQKEIKNVETLGKYSLR